MSLMPLMFFQGIEGYVGRSNPLVVLSRFFKLSPMAISNMHVASSKTMPDEEQRKSSVECTSQKIKIPSLRIRFFKRGFKFG